MSYSTIYRIEPNGDIDHHEDFSNAFRGAFMIWKTLADRHLGGEFNLLSGMQKVWDLAKNPDLPRHERIVMAATFDNVLCRQADFPELVAALRAFQESLPAGERYCHAGAWADSIEKLPPECLGCGWRQTSVIANPWLVPTGEDESRPYNIHTDQSHSWLLDLVG